MKWIRRMGYVLLFVLIALAFAFVFGPRVANDTTITLDTAPIAADPDAWLAASESKFNDIKPAQGKEIIWAFPQSKAKTPYALVYVHGFSASRGEILPVTDDLAKELQANIYYTRLAGHGRSNDALAEGSISDWVNDIAEALEIGRAIGDKVVVIGVSTGGTLAAWAATQPTLMDRVDSMIFVSPNFGLVSKTSAILSLPFGGALADLIVGKTRSFETRSDKHAEFWTHTYPTRALLPMKALVDLAGKLRFSAIKTPALFIYDPADTVVDESQTARIAALWGGPSETHIVEGTGDPNHHVVAGDALSPQSNQQVLDVMAAFIRKAH
jgi:pimeloyl-ACP methyl ester carboxylesterase